MTSVTAVPVTRTTPTPDGALHALADLGFMASPDLPDREGPASLLVAIRPAPTLRHFDPEAIDYWIAEGGRGVRRTLDRDTRMPLEAELSWGEIQIVDRLKVTNEYLAFGGHLTAASIDGVTVVVITSPAPLLRRGGHSQPWDLGAESLGAFFGRLLLAVDYTPGFEARAAAATSETRYAAFLIDAVGRLRASPALRTSQPDLWVLLDAAERHLRTRDPMTWANGKALLYEAHMDRA
jgi:hypothetical protein